MAAQRFWNWINSLSAKTALTGSEELYINDAGVSKKTTVDDLRHKNYGEMYQYNQTFILPIDWVNVYHPLRNFLAGNLDGVTFDAGSAGAVTAVANAGGGDITVTSNGHGLLAGEPVYFAAQDGSSYKGSYLVKTAATNTFTVTKPYVATATFNWYQPSTLRVSTAGIYLLNYNVTANSEGSSKNYKCEVSRSNNAAVTDLDTSAEERLFSSGADYGNLVGGCLVALNANDYVWLQTKCTSDASDLNLRHGNMRIVKIN